MERGSVSLRGPVIPGGRACRASSMAFSASGDCRRKTSIMQITACSIASKIHAYRRMYQRYPREKQDPKEREKKKTLVFGDGRVKSAHPGLYEGMTTTYFHRNRHKDGTWTRRDNFAFDNQDETFHKTSIQYGIFVIKST
ncbi:hypothetical protein PDE_02931 [Penicillium oxalicum 114-2]|uniref:Uncharacterized protein n=1 Tax=Penicillium oxalicum (strain 114-2 / CGMCC 5302) TaxID=933388 RepID=S7ZH43_PENO1|nr:hypothetical protein PDE_02931 [Penicillium oxalicum 114-2]